MTRNTIQRTLVLNAVKHLKNHATADEVYEYISKKHPDVSKATVYRNLNKLAEEGFIRKNCVPSGADRFDHKCHKHYHVKCESCGKFFDVDMEYMSDLEEKINDTNGFKITSHDIIFSGICLDCQ